MEAKQLPKGTPVTVETASATYRGTLTLAYRGEDVQFATSLAPLGYYHISAALVRSITS